MKKAPEAFRTISEVAEILGTPAHVLRFWESKFYQIRPVKRAGGRRYYRPDDVALINGIRFLLQEREMTIRGVQRVLQDEGVKYVAGLGGPLTLGDPVEAIVDPQAEAAPLEDAATDAIAVAVATGADEAETVAFATDAVADSVAETVAAPVVADVDMPGAAQAAVPAEDAEPAPDVSALHATVDAPPPPPIPPTATADAPNEDTVMTDGETLTPDQPAAPKVPSGALPPTFARASDPPAFDPAETSERAQIARQLRAMPRGRLGPRRDRLDLLSRRIDTLLERMSEASGAGRW